MRYFIILLFMGANVLYTGALVAQTDPVVRKSHFLVSYLGIPVLDCYQDFRRGDSLITVVYDNQIKPFWAKFSAVHNIYAATFTPEEFVPRTDAKEISEGKFQQSLAVTYAMGERHLIFGNGRRMAWPTEFRSVFSAVHYLEKWSGTLNYPLQLPLVIEGARWQANIDDLGRVKIDVNGESMPTRHLRVAMEPLGGKSVLKRTDVLMDFLATPGSKLELWIDDTPQIVRAKVGDFPKAVVLELVKKDVMTRETD